ncbi:MAG: hypothetical protein ACR2NP_20085 [Pirellulaceae bacterium]
MLVALPSPRQHRKLVASTPRLGMTKFFHETTHRQQRHNSNRPVRNNRQGVAMIQTKWVLFCPAWFCMCCCGPLNAQPLDLSRHFADQHETVELPKLIPYIQEPVVSVPDGGRIIFGGGYYQPEINLEIVPALTIENGSRVYRFSVDGKPWQIAINEDDSIDVTMVKEFTIEHLAELRRLHPDIAARLENFPENSMRATQINWQFEITSSVSVMHEGQLRNLYPGLHEVFTQHIKPIDR